MLWAPYDGGYVITTVLIDADIVSYRCSAVTEKNDFALCKWQTDQLITRIIEDVNADDWKLFLTAGNNNFRYLIYPSYKANRRDQPKPRHLEALREYLVLDWQAELVDGYEADDALGIELSKGTKTIAASIDKDLLQIPGIHYNFVNRQMVDVDETNGARQFFKQLLIGDSTDNIKGCPGIGKIKAEKYLENFRTVEELYGRCMSAYKDVYSDKWEQELDLNAQLIYIWRQPEDKWTRLLRPKGKDANNIIENIIKDGGKKIEKNITTTIENAKNDEPYL